jgi:hypothetical protein
MPQDTTNWENHRIREQTKVGRKSATSEIITKKYAVKQSAKSDEWKTPCVTEYKNITHTHISHIPHKIRTDDMKSN